MRSRVLWVIPVAAVVLIGLVVYRQLIPRKQVVSPELAAAVVRPVPSLYELDDQRARRVALKAFIGRHKMLIVFVKTAGGAGPAAVSKSGETSPATPELRESPLLQTIRRDFARIQEAGAILHVISNATPWNNRQRQESDQHFPYPILADVEGSVHRSWLGVDPRSDDLLEGVCVVDRKGFIVRTFLGPDHLGTPDDWIAALK